MKIFAVLAGALAVTSAMAQTGAPSDVPRDHWAFSAVDNLFREGILKGYPDGSFNGSRPVSRYELASTVNALFQKQMTTLTGLQNRLNGLPSPATNAQAPELRELNQTLAALRIDVEKLQAKRAEMPSLTSEFESLSAQLKSLRQSMDATQQDVGKLKD